jgi:hypothetical protein
MNPAVPDLNDDTLACIFEILDAWGTEPHSEGKRSLSAVARVCRAWNYAQLSTRRQ